MSKTYLYWDPVEDNIVREYDDAGVVTAEYTTEPDLYGNVISQRRQGEYRQFHYDAQGSTLVATDANQSVTDTFIYTAFGEVTERTGDGTIPFQFVGQHGYYLEPYLRYYVRRRFFGAFRDARWLSPDPLGVRVGEMSPYRYVVNRPVVLVDPSGLSFCELELAKCCCCAVGVDIPKESIRDIDKVPDIRIPGERWAKQFSAVITTKWVEHSEEIDCELQWWERAFHPLLEGVQFPNKWYNNFFKDSSTFFNWVKTRKKPCPGEETTQITDHPSVPLGGALKSYTQTIWFIIKVNSAKGCPCEKPWAIKYAKLDLNTKFGVGESRPFTPFEERPANIPDLPATLFPER